MFLSFWDTNSCETTVFPWFISVAERYQPILNSKEEMYRLVEFILRQVKLIIRVEETKHQALCHENIF